MNSCMSNKQRLEEMYYFKESMGGKGRRIQSTHKIVRCFHTLCLNGSICDIGKKIFRQVHKLNCY